MRRCPPRRRHHRCAPRTARLNVADGLWALYNRPWTAEYFDQPRIESHSGAVDLRRAYYHSDSRTLLITARPRDDSATDLALVVTHAPPRPCVIAVNGVTAAVDDDSTGIDVTADGDTLRLRTSLTYETTVALRWT
jgi:hypothetical protein